ncbi:beta strand repeat-containing protein, partial [Planctomycetota bacterium]
HQADPGGDLFAGESYVIFGEAGPGWTLTDTELDNITTSNKIVVGDSNAGDVTITGAMSPANATRLELISGATIGDTNTTGYDYADTSLVLDGNVNPGTSPGILSVDADVELVDNSGFTVEIGGTSPGNTDTNHDQLSATGSVTIGTNVTLTTVSWNGYTLTGSESFTVIERTGGTGTFDSRPEGYTFTNFFGSGLDATLTYAGGDGDDIVITVLCNTDVTLVGNTLTITDISGGDSDDDLSISFAGGQYTITDNGGLTIYAGSIAGSTGTGSSTVTVPQGTIDAINVVTLAGDDTVTMNSTDTGVGVTITGGDDADTVNWESTVQIGSLDLTVETINLNSGAVNTGTDNQTYSGAVVLGDDTTLTGADVVFNSTVDGDIAGRTLVINTSGDTIFNGVVGGTDALESIKVDSTGSTVDINAAMNVGTGGLDIDPPDTINVNAPINSAGGDVSLTATGDIALNDAVTTGGGAFTVHADSDGDGTGTFNISPGFIEQHKLTASNAGFNMNFGWSVSMDGDTLVVGTASNSAYVFTRIANTWVEQQILTGSDVGAGDGFGGYVSVSGDTIVLGAPMHDIPYDNCGAAYVFTWDGSTWTEQQKLTPSDAFPGDTFGSSVSIDDDTILVGAPSGSAYVFTRTGDIWTEEKILIPLDGNTGKHFGYSVSVDGDTAVVGAFTDNHAGPSSGAVYVYIRSGSTWIEQKKLKAFDAAQGDYFGRSVSVEGDTVVVGADADDDAGAESGSAYVFDRSDSNWTQHKLTAFDGGGGDSFGYSVSVDSDTVLVGAPKDNDAGNNSGSAYVFTRSGGAWTYHEKLTSFDAAAYDLFGWSVFIDLDTVLVGVRSDDHAGLSSGSAYIFQRSSGIVGGSVTTDSGSIDVTAAQVDIAGTVSGNGTLTFVPSIVNSSIGLGGGIGTFNIVDTELDHLVNGFSSITIGDTASGTGTVDVDTATFQDPVTIAGGTINDHTGTDITAPEVTLQGNVAPGQSPGVLEVDGDVDMADGDTLTIEIDGTAGAGVAGGHDQLSATGSVDIIGTVTLTLTGTPTLSGGETFTIISRTGGTGSFDGMPERTVFTDFLGS